MEHFTKLLSKWLVFDGTDVSLSELEVHTDELFVNVKYIHIDNCIQPPEILEAIQHNSTYLAFSTFICTLYI